MSAANTSSVTSASKPSRGIETAQQLAARFEIHLSQTSTWKHRLLESASDLFVRGTKRDDNSAREAKLYEHIGDQGPSFV